MVDYPSGAPRANVHAPDSMTATFSMTGPTGSGGNLVETGFDDSPETDTSSGGGKARTLVLNTGGVPANAVRLDFLTDAEWLMLSEVTEQQGRAATNVIVKATAILDTPPNFNGGASAGLLTDGVIGADNWLGGGYLGWQDAGYVPSDAGTDSGGPATATDIRPGRSISIPSRSTTMSIILPTLYAPTFAPRIR